jgi:N-carbamoyl-L-amino-acid hydrolase
MRHDALVAGAELILAVKHLATNGLVRVATAGAVRCVPNLHNVVPGRVDLGIDIRDSDDARIRQVVELVKDTAASIAEANGVAIVVREGLFVAATPIDPTLRSDVEEAALPLGSVMRLPSGASHDAQIMSSIAPVAMLFVPSRHGLSHNPAEWTSPEELILGATCLADIVLRVDRRP